VAAVLKKLTKGSTEFSRLQLETANMRVLGRKPKNSGVKPDFFENYRFEES
jgi:hypothetical protein